MLRRLFHFWERRLASRDTNRTPLPFDLGLEWVPDWGSAGDGDNPAAHLRAELQRALENSDQFSATFNDSYENLLEDAQISGATIPVGRYSFRDVELSYNFGPQRPYSGRLSVLKGDYFTGDRTSIGFNQARI